MRSSDHAIGVVPEAMTEAASHATDGAVHLIGFDFGSTTSSAMVVRTRIGSHSTTGLAARSANASTIARLVSERVGELGIDLALRIADSPLPSGGLPPVEAGSVVAENICRILEDKAAGNRLESPLAGRA
jgi:hypothetical protein